MTSDHELMQLDELMTRRIRAADFLAAHPEYHEPTAAERAAQEQPEPGQLPADIERAFIVSIVVFTIALLCVMAFGSLWVYFKNGGTL